MSVGEINSNVASECTADSNTLNDDDCTSALN